MPSMRSTGRFEFPHNLTGLSEKHAYADFARADHDCRDFGVAGTPHEQVDKVVAVDEYLLERKTQVV